MPLLRVVFVMIWAMAFISARALIDISTAVSEGGLHQQDETPRVRDAATEDRRPPAWSPPRADVNGNPVDEALSDYRVDGRGDMYERHAPRTALPKLGSPGA